MKRRDLLEIWAVLQEIGDIKAGVAFNYALGKNYRKLKPEIEDLQKPLEEKRMALIKEYAEKDESGKPVIVSDGVMQKYKFLDGNEEKFNIEFEPIREEFEKLLDEEVTDFSFHLIELQNFPELTTRQMRILMPMIKEPAE